MNLRLGIVGSLGFCLSYQIIAGAAIGGCVVRSGIDVTPPRFVASTSTDPGETGATKVDALAAPPPAPAASGNKYHVATTGYQPTNDIEDIALRHGVRAVTAELDQMQERCGFTIPVELMYAVPMKAWVGAEGWGNHRGCTNEAKTGGCMNLSMCASEVVSMFWFDLCGGLGEGVKKEYRGWNTKVKKLVCRGEAAPPETSAMDHQTSRMSAVLSKDGTLTVTLHPSDANVSFNFGEWLSPRVEAD